MTIGSPLVASVSGPGTAETNASVLLSGDQVKLSPWPGSGEFVPVVFARNVRPEPSGFTVASPCCSLTDPVTAIRFPSGDQRGCDNSSFSPPIRLADPPAASAIQSCEYEEPG